MIEIGSGINKQKIGCLTRLDEGQVELRLHPRKPGERRTIILAEPSALTYARLRIQMMDADKELTEKYPEPSVPPDEIEGESEWDRAQRIVAYNTQVSQWIDDRANYRTDPEHAPYATVLLAVIEKLGNGQTVGLDDLTPEAFKANVLQALLETWEAPLDGPVSPPATPTPAPPTADLDEQPAADSPESTRSSPPSGEPSDPSPPAPSTT
jgi:hypothetical protein